MIATGIFQSGLDGHQRIDIRCWLLMTGAVLQLFLAFLLTPRFGLMGMAYVRIIQNFVILAASWLILRKIVPQLPSIPRRFNRSLFKEMIGYGANFQLIAFLNMFFEPVTKMFLGKFGSLAMVGYYEMANRMIQQVRALLVSANQTIVPAIAGLKEVSPEQIRSVYQTSYRLMFYLAVPIFSLMIVALPVISFLWIGHIESLFVTMGLIIALGWLLNTLNAPAYFVYLGIGELRWNVVSHLLIATLNLGMGFILGRHFGGLGVVSASASALGIGSAVIIISFSGKNGIPDSDMAPRDSRTVGILCIIGLGLMFLRLWPGFPLLRSGVGSAIFLMIFFLALSVILFHHPMKGTIIGWVREGFFKATSKE
jgi:O-antigen/teichoic acid export membrane protein